MGGNLLIIHAAQLVTPKGRGPIAGADMSSLAIIPDGALVIEKGIITRVGRTEEVLPHVDREKVVVIDAAGKAVLPGFVDSHTHFIFGGYRAEEFSWRIRGESYMEIMRRGGGIVNSVQATRNASKEELKTSGRARLDRMLAFGVTTVEGKSGYGLDRDTEIKQLEVMEELDTVHPIDVVRTFLGAHAVPPEFEGNGDRFIDYLIEKVLPEIARFSLAEFADIFCEKGVFSVDQSRRLLLAARAAGMKLKIHADEITHLGGAELAIELKAQSADHLLHASDVAIDGMAHAGIVATLLPATAFSLREPYARARFMIDHGCAVALATDFNPGSCFTESIPLLFALATLHMGMTPEEALTALTLNGAAALGRAETIGSLEEGKAGDVVVLEYPSYLYIPYHIAVNSVEKVVKNGEIVVDRKGTVGGICYRS